MISLICFLKFHVVQGHVLDQQAGMGEVHQGALPEIQEAGAAVAHLDQLFLQQFLHTVVTVYTPDLLDI